MATIRKIRVPGGLMWALLAAVAGGCTSSKDEHRQNAEAIQRARLLLEQYDCGSCHIIPGVRRAQGLQGPSLNVYARRAYIAGEVPNRQEELVRWLQHPRELVPDTLMPDLGVSRAAAHDMSQYLMSLR